MKQRTLFVSFYTTYGMLYLISLLPMPVLYGIAAFFSFLAYRIVNYRKVVVVTNISRSFPEKKYREVDRVVKAFYSNFFANFAEIVKYLSSSARSMEKKNKKTDPLIINTYS
ncbi:hypothetical protein LJB84_03045 [Bacteroidales bacterium OttesenSCG-928-J19]|nr:hypothetical protein [Bacteroidales bacterium OttesenSCG-928-J19]